MYLMTHCVEHFYRLMGHLYVFFWKCLFELCPKFMGLLVFLLLSYKRFIAWIPVLCQICFVNILSNSVACLLIFLMVSLTRIFKKWNLTLTVLFYFDYILNYLSLFYFIDVCFYYHCCNNFLTFGLLVILIFGLLSFSICIIICLFFCFFPRWEHIKPWLSLYPASCISQMLKCMCTIIQLEMFSTFLCDFFLWLVYIV